MKADRAQLAKLLSVIEAGDVLMDSRLDRLARSTRDLLNILDAVAARGASFRSLGDTRADTATPHGWLMLTVSGGLAEFERELIRAHMGEGRTRAKARGAHMGRPSKLTPHQRREAHAEMAADTATQSELARRFNVSQSIISRLAEKATVALVSVVLAMPRRAGLRSSPLYRGGGRPPTRHRSHDEGAYGVMPAEPYH